MIEHLFSKGKAISVFPLKLLYVQVDDAEHGLKAGVTTSSRNFRKAVQRNRVKRILRESYRLQKPALQQWLTNQEKSLAVFFIYTGKELPEFNEVHEKMGLVLQKLLDILKRQTNKS